MGAVAAAIALVLPLLDTPKEAAVAMATTTRRLLLALAAIIKLVLRTKLPTSRLMPPMYVIQSLVQVDPSPQGPQ